MKIAIAGYGVEGEANYAYWAKDPANELTIVDEREPSMTPPEGATVLIGSDKLKALQGYDLVIRTAGLAPYKLATDGKVWSGTNEFFAKCPALIIGVTGSKGKGTTASLIASILEAAGKKVWLVGNIGKPAISVVDQIRPTDIVVYELSSFQLWDLQASPHVAVVLYIEREHLDVHRSMQEYVEAKAQITRWQGPEDRLVYNVTNEYAQAIAQTSQAHKVPYPSNDAAHIRDDYFYYDGQRLCLTSALQIPGAHNLSNAVAAIDAAWEYVQDPAAIEAGLRAFKGLPHRLAFVRNVDGIDYYDDSIATTPGSAIAAMRAFKGRSQVLILGGSPKGSDFSSVAAEALQHDVRVLLIGDETDRIAEALDSVGFTNYERVDGGSMTKLVRRAAEIAQPGGVVLLSPAAASFGLFKNYVDRGEQFISAVNGL